MINKAVLYTRVSSDEQKRRDFRWIIRKNTVGNMPLNTD